MSDRKAEFLLIGGGLAAGNCARHLREQGAQGEILLIGREPHLPYNRPELSKKYVRGEEPVADVMFRPDEFFAEQDIETLTRTSVIDLDAATKTVQLSNKQEIAFDKALLATGANVRILHVDGAELDGIHYLRTLANADVLREELASAERVAIVGGSFIATELAASFTALGKQVELLMLEDVTLERFFGPEVGGFVQSMLVDHGVVVHGGEQLERFEGSDGRARKLVAQSGLEIDCDFVVIGAGVHPDVHLAERAGLELGAAGGVATDEFLQTSVPDIFAAGDAAEYESVLHGRRMRIEHWDVAFNHGKYVALNMLGQKRAYDVVPYFWSDLADWGGIEYVGPAYEWDEIWWRGSVDEGSFTAWYVRNGRLGAALTAGRSDDLSVAGRMLERGAELGEDQRRVIEDVEAELGVLAPE
jgi:3-phenylpropionate/trans-cinnamate dioxygenase ferredoxin reductase subunit